MIAIVRKNGIMRVSETSRLASRHPRPTMKRSWTCLPMLFVPFLWGETKEPAPPAVDFNRQIRPILSEHCFACHGPDEKTRKAKLRLDTKEGIRRVVMAGKPDESDLVDRITESDVSRVMPPRKFNKPLKAEQIDLLRRWVQAGANWSEHWAFVTPKKPDLPKVSAPEWARNPLDHFVLARLDREGLKPASEADRATLIRR